MKGISAVIAVVLILMITVALAAMAYVWFTGVFENISESAGEAATKTGETIATSFSIASAVVANNSYADIYITNTGSSDIDQTAFNVFVAGKLATRKDGLTGNLQPSRTATLHVTNTTGLYTDPFCGKTIKVTYGSLDQVATILCE